MLSTRADRAERRAEREREWNEILRPPSLAEMLAGRARDGMSKLDAYLNGILAGSTKDQRAHAPTAPEPAEQPHSRQRSEEPTSELQSLMRIPYAVFCFEKKHI